MNEIAEQLDTMLLDKQLIELFINDSTRFGCPITTEMRCRDCTKLHGCPIHIYDQKGNKHTFKHLKLMVLLERLKFKKDKTQIKN